MYGPGTLTLAANNTFTGPLTVANGGVLNVATVPNGGVNGHPIQYSIETEQTDPAQAASVAKKLIQTDKVVGIVGNTSIIECAVNHKYYEKKGYYVIIAGVPGECFGTPNIAPVNMGPRYSNIGAAQALVRRGAKSLMVASPDTISAYADGGNTHAVRPATAP